MFRDVFVRGELRPIDMRDVLTILGNVQEEPPWRILLDYHIKGHESSVTCQDLYSQLELLPFVLFI